MKYAKKSMGKQVSAYELGAGSAMEEMLLRKGLIRKTAQGEYALISQEVAVAFLEELKERADNAYTWMCALKILEVPGAWARMMELLGIEVAGQVAQKGDFFKVDGAGFPYPNAREWFEANHRHLEGDLYEQIPKPLAIWMADDGEHEVADWLMQQGKLVIRENEPDRYFNAHLWGADLSATRDAVVVFYGVERDATGAIVDVNFNLVARPEFDRDYVICG